MADINVSGVYDPPGGLIRLDQPGQRITGSGVVRGGVYIPKAGAGAVIEPAIKLEIPGESTLPGAVQCAASSCGIHCAIDGGGKGMQGVQIIADGNEIPDGVDISGLRVYNLGEHPMGDRHMHGIYVQDSTDLYGENCWFEDIEGGWALHFYCNQAVRVSKGARLLHITCKSNRGDVVYWGPGVEDNKVSRLYSEGVDYLGTLTVNDDAEGKGNECDFVTTPTDDYGYQESSNGGDGPTSEEKVTMWEKWYAQAPKY